MNEFTLDRGTPLLALKSSFHWWQSKEAELLLAGRLVQGGGSELPPLGAEPRARAKLGHVCSTTSQGSKWHATSIQLQFIAKKKKDKINISSA